VTNANGGRLTKNERREQAREQARLLREAAKKKERRNRILLQGGIIVGVLAVLAVIALVIVSSVKPSGPGPENMASGGILFEPGGEVHTTPATAQGQNPVPNPAPTGGDVVQIQTYIDFQCPYCKQFEDTNLEYIRTLVDSGAASLEVFPISILDRSSQGTEYSSRSANAAACLAQYDPDAFLDFVGLAYANQPAEGTSGLTDDEIVNLASQAGASSSTVADCIRNRQFDAWVQSVTKFALSDSNPLGAITATPTVFVNGQKYGGSITSQDDFRAFVQSVAGVANLESSPTPTPTPSAS